MVLSGLVPAVGGIARANPTALPPVRGFPALRAGSALLAALSFADSTLLTLIRCPHRGRLLVQRFPARPLHVPLRADRSAQGLSASSPAPPGVCRSQGGRGKECAPPSCSWAVHSPVVWHPNGRPRSKQRAVTSGPRRQKSSGPKTRLPRRPSGPSERGRRRADRAEVAANSTPRDRAADTV